MTYRPGRAEDLHVCPLIWQEAIDDYQRRLNQPPLDSDLAPLRRLLAHTLASDPDRFWVALDADEEVCGFASATLREGLWFLAMLFVRPGTQAAGVGGALMDRTQAGRDVDPGGPAVPGPDEPFATGIHTWGMCTDAAQPISNGLYARRGMVPRIPVWRLVGEVRRWSAVPPLPASLEAVAFERVETEGTEGQRRLAEQLAVLDREIIGSAHQAEHGFLRREGRQGFLVRERGAGAGSGGSGASGRSVHGYVYGSGGGRLGPMAALDPALHAQLVGVAVRETPMVGAVAMWVPGTADRAMRALLEAGLRLEGFPGLICWSRSEHPFERYVPISLALV